jgi:hypothetical protein
VIEAVGSEKGGEAFEGSASDGPDSNSKHMKRLAWPEHVFMGAIPLGFFGNLAGN